MKNPTMFLFGVIGLGILWLSGVGMRSTYAQEEVRFESLQIDLWPEYDRPEMLVVYRFRIAAEVQLPVSVNIRIPVAAGAPNAVADAAEGGPLMNLEYRSVIQGNWNVLQFTAVERDVQIEFYDPSIQKEGSTRTYLYQWPGGYDIEQVVMLVQEPIGAEEMQVLPRLEDITVGDKGIVYHRGELGSYRADENFERSITYKKDSESLSIEFLEIDSPPVNEDTAGRVSIVNIIPWGIGLLGVIVIVAGVYWYWATENRVIMLPQKGKASHQKQKQEVKKIVQAKTSDQDVYCHQCGKRAEENDKFCRSCGTKLRH